MSKIAVPILVLALLPAVAPQARADVLELAPIKDNTLFEDATGSLSNGAGTRMFAGMTAQPGLRRGLVAFDVASNLPEDAIIVSVTLTLEQVMTISGTYDVALHRALEDWGEGSSVAPSGQGVGGPATPGDVTWLHTFYDTDFWSTPGGNYVTTPSASTAITGYGPFEWRSAEMVQDVEDWLWYPDQNFGWVIVGNETDPGSAKTFSTREASSGGPLLTIEWYPNTGCDGGMPVPAVAPWGAVLLALVVLNLAILVLRRRSTGEAR